MRSDPAFDDEYGERGPERVTLDERALLDRAVDLVGRDVEEPVDLDVPGYVAQHVGAEAVGPHERVRVDDRAVDVALGREVDHGVVAGHGHAHRVAIADVALDERVARVVGDVGQAGQVAGVGQRVEDRHLVVGRGEHVADVVGTDEPGRAGHEQLHGDRRPLWWAGGQTSGRGLRAATRRGAATAPRCRPGAGWPGRAWTGSGPRHPSRRRSQGRPTPRPARQPGCSSRRRDR